MLVCADAAAEIEFCRRAFDAVELSRRTAPNGTVVHGLLKVEGALVMVHDVTATLASRAPGSDASSPVVIYLYVVAVDAVVARAVAAGARVILPAQDQSWGDRVARIADPAGHVWNIAARVNAVSP